MLLVAPPAGGGGRAEYVGGTLASLEKRAAGQISVTNPMNFEFHSRAAALRVPYERINLIEYGQTVNRRYGLALLMAPILVPAAPLLAASKKRTHFLTVGYADDGGQQQALVFRVDKKDIRAVLAGLEARTGRKVLYQDEETRKGEK